MSVTSTAPEAHNIGHFRFVECSRLRDGRPDGDVTPYDPVFFPFDPDLDDDGDLQRQPVRRRDGGPDVEERYVVTPAFHLTGPIVRELDVLVDGRAKQVDRLENPDVEVTTDSTTFIQLACGRIDPQVRIDSGAINWKGDAELGERAARNLRFTM